MRPVVLRCLPSESVTIPRVIRLRQSLETGFRHPLFGPLLLALVALVLAFVVFHTVEHGVEGLLVTCAIVTAVALRLAVVVGRIWTVRSEHARPGDRAPPVRLPLLRAPDEAPPSALLALPLRR